MSIMRMFQIQCLLVLPVVVDAGFLRGVITPPSAKASPTEELTSDSSFAELRKNIADLEGKLEHHDMVVEKKNLATQIQILEERLAKDRSPEEEHVEDLPNADQEAELEKEGRTNFMTKFGLVEQDLECVSACGYSLEMHHRPGWKQCSQKCITNSPRLFKTLMKLLPDSTKVKTDVAATERREGVESLLNEVPTELLAIKALASEVTTKLIERRKQREAEL